MTTPKRKPVRNDWTGSEIPQATTIPPYVIMRALKSFDAIRAHAERAPFPDPELVRQHGEREVVMSSFAMIRGMAELAIDRIEQECGWTVADAKAVDAANYAAVFPEDKADDDAV